MIQDKSSYAALARFVPVVLSFAIALTLSVTALPESIQALRPDLVSLVLIFWCLYHPGRVGLLTAFVIGILADTMYFGTLGQHAIAKLMLAYVILKFTPGSDVSRKVKAQSVLVLFLLLADAAVIEVISRILHDHGGSYEIWLAPLTGGLLWYLFAGIRHLRTRPRYGN